MSNRLRQEQRFEALFSPRRHREPDHLTVKTSGLAEPGHAG
jgi:hypothetical protein